MLFYNHIKQKSRKVTKKIRYVQILKDFFLFF